MRFRGSRPSDTGPFLWLSKDAHERALAIGETTGLAVLVGMCKLESDAMDVDKSSWRASLGEIGRACGLSRKRVGRYVEMLIEAGIVTRIEPTGAEKLRNESARYTITVPDDPKRDIRETQSGTFEGDESGHSNGTLAMLQTSHCLEKEQKEPKEPLAPGPARVGDSRTKPRKSDLVFEALAAVSGHNLAELTGSARGAINKGAKDIRAACDGINDEGIAQQVRLRARRYRELHPSWGVVTPLCLAKYWSTLDGKHAERRENATRTASRAPIPPAPKLLGEPNRCKSFAEAMRASGDRALGEAVGST